MDIRTDITALKVADFMEKDKIIMKVVEECMELCEVLVKTVTKAEGFKPPADKIIEEMGDTYFRMAVLAKKLLIENAVEDRIIVKGRQLDEWVDSKQTVNQ